MLRSAVKGSKQSEVAVTLKHVDFFYKIYSSEFIYLCM